MAGLRKVLGLPTGGVNAALTDDMRLIITSDNNAIEALWPVKMAWWLLCTIWAVCSAQVPRLRRHSECVDRRTRSGVYVLTVQGEGTSYTRKVVVK